METSLLRHERNIDKVYITFVMETQLLSHRFPTSSANPHSAQKCYDMSEHVAESLLDLEGNQLPDPEEGVRWQGRIYDSWPNRICCYLAGLDMLEKESIYCRLSGGPPRLGGAGEVFGG